MNLSFSTLRQANTLRLPLFKNSRGGLAHSQPDGSDWSLGEWMNAILGELGEAANLIKKVKRGDMPLEAARDELGKEFADIIIYTDLTALQIKRNIGNEGWTFADLRSRGAVVGGVGDISLGETLTRSTIYFGALAMLAFGKHYTDTIVQENLLNFIQLIDCAADKIGINLGDAVRTKFNAVSLRVGAPVFITNEDRVETDPSVIAQLRGC